MSTKSNQGITLFTLLGVLFVGLKLCHVINWSWWLVLLPLYCGFAVIILTSFFIFVCTVGKILWQSTHYSKKNQR
jgi:hypothetical protein